MSIEMTAKNKILYLCYRCRGHKDSTAFSAEQLKLHHCRWCESCENTKTGDIPK